MAACLPSIDVCSAPLSMCAPRVLLVMVLFDHQRYDGTAQLLSRCFFFLLRSLLSLHPDVLSVTLLNSLSWMSLVTMSCDLLPIRPSTPFGSEVMHGEVQQQAHPLPLPGRLQLCDMCDQASSTLTLCTWKMDLKLDSSSEFTSQGCV